ncbi:MAG: 3-oxoacyl-[acyl-carrier protein] reductase [Petroclostridium sp.]|uniref:3-oxoacyl-ACP reductase family protein n=1 Tax=Petroclostridium xylanilyticum TaxID=1792311 RepID=UPI0018E2B94C|nr:3-oxoacyl-ACP reductase family protein [Petroclostridium xylanilyticum]MBZ4646765.1 3-oxoacyl-(acyl-carrier-protein) reductase [Clostridia bacterium]MDK2809499.1 3-oxoacyl-[acyl-carrier protein] reductase [Petroclostridium sp.]
MDYINYFKDMHTPFLEGKVAIITGASRGIGREAAELMAELGAKVVISYARNDELAKELYDIVTQKGQQALLFKGDLAQYEEAKQLIEKTIGKFGKIDILINNAGITDPRFFLELSEEDWDRMMDTNLKSIYNCCKHVVPYMMKQGYGKIINMSSVVAKSGSIGAGAHYCAAKAGVIGFTKALANQLAPHGITVNSIAPAMIDTEMIRWRTPEQMKEHVELIPLKRIGLCSEVTQAIAFLSSKFADFITGYCMDINGGLYMD